MTGWPLPLNPNPPQTVCVQLQVPDDPNYLAAFWGAVLDLSVGFNWANDTAHTAKIAAARMRQMYLAAQLNNCGLPPPPSSSGGGMMEMLMFRQDGCKLQVSVGNDPDTGAPCWCTIFDSSLCTQAPQPGPTPTPGPGVCQTYKGVLQGNGQLNLPVGLSSGDTYQITSVAGATADGSLTTPWRCWDGFQFFLGTCTGVQIFEGGDPMPAVPHQHVIALIGGVPTIIDETVRTVVGGVANAPFVLQVNDSNLTDNTGSLEINVQVCKASAVPPTNWTATIDLTTTTGPFNIQTFSGQPSATWAGGVGFTENQFNNGDFITGVYIKAVITAFTMLTCQVYMSVTLGDNSLVGGSDTLSGQIINGTLEEHRTVATSSNGPFNYLFNPGSPQAGITTIEEFNYASDGANVAYKGGHSIVSKVVIGGTGPIPPELLPYV
jgi:hypothetical protein